MSEPRTIDLNADVGEGSDDAPLYEIVTSVNVACGAHAGDEKTMRTAVALSIRHGVALGAHPGYHDRAGMGRRPMSLPPHEIERLVVEQVRALARLAAEAGTRLRHVKPHGALYNQAAVATMPARAIAAAVAAVDPALTLVGLSGGESVAAARAAGLAVAEEAFCDRGYRPDGTLIPRAEPGALIDDPEAAAARAVAIATGAPVDAPPATLLVRAGTLCLHGDTPGALARGVAVRRALKAAGVALAPV